MSTSPFDANGLQFAWDSTSTQLAMDCLWKYKAMMLDNWTSKRKSAHLIFGGLYASALEHFHKHLANGMDREEALRRIVLETLASSWENDPDCKICAGTGDQLVHPQGVPFSQSLADMIPCACGKPWASDHNTKTRENLIRTIIWYCDQFNPDPLEVVTLSDGRPAVEYSFALEIDNGLIYSGHIDRLVRYNDEVYVQDQKTTGSTITQQYFRQFDPDVQMSGYSFAAKAIWPGPVRGVIIDAAQVAVGFSRFERGFTFRTEAKLEEWYQDTLYWIGLARRATEEQRFPRNRTSCTKYGGCIFQTVCSRSPEVREQFLKADFEKREQWNPLNKR